MNDDPAVTAWQERLIAEAVDDLSGWEREHPKATFAQIEEAVEERISDLRAGFTEDLLRNRAAASSGASGSNGRSACPSCGKPMESRGEHERTVTIRGNRQVKMRRGYQVCPACSAGLFPPG
jgi:hypothetical protein